MCWRRASWWPPCCAVGAHPNAPPSTCRQAICCACWLASLALGLPLAISGILPQFTETLAGHAQHDSAVAGRIRPPPWPRRRLGHAGAAAAARLRPGLAAPRVWPLLGNWPNRISYFSQLQWLFRLSMWGIDRLALVGNNAVHVVEGGGYLGWFLVFMLIALLLLR